MKGLVSDVLWAIGIPVAMTCVGVLVGLLVGNAIGYRTAQREFQRPCEITCGVTFTEDGWVVKGGRRDEQH